MRIGKPQHEATLAEFAEQLRKKGYRVIILNGASPDGIAISPEGRVCAIEVLGQSWRAGHGWGCKSTFAEKKRLYSMFDDILFAVFRYSKAKYKLRGLTNKLQARKEQGNN